jgi:tetratricopeptide (TPR) repeat protein
MELSDETHEEIVRLSKAGDALAEERRFEAALAKYAAALSLLPEPKEDWEAATWLFSALGDAHFLKGDFAAGRESFATAMRCPGALGNPFIHLRLGQCQFQLGQLDRAADELMRAYMGAGRKIFDREDLKYLLFLSTKAKDIESPKKAWQFWR